MEQQEGQETVYPPGYAHIENNVRDTQERVQQIDEQIKHVPADSKPVPRLTPPGFLQPRHFSREEKVASLEVEKSELKETTFKQIERDVRDADPRIARIVRDQSRETLYPNPFKQMGASEKIPFRSLPKDVELSQDYMDSLFSKSADRTEKKNVIKGEASSMSMHFSLGLGYTNSDMKIDKEIGSMSGRFLQNLSFTKAIDAPSKPREREVDKERD